MLPRQILIWFITAAFFDRVMALVPHPSKIKNRFTTSALYSHLPSNDLVILSRRMLMGDLKSPPKIIIAGAPASGKGTQCELIKEKYRVVHLSTGDMLREAVSAGTDLGKLAKEYMDSGKLVPDDLIIGVVRDRLAQSDCHQNGWLLDGFPRTEAQALALAEFGISADHFVVLNVPDEILVERVVGRRTDPENGRIYHLTFFPPETEEIRARLIQRVDDTEEKIVVRIEAFKANCAAVSGCYKEITLQLDGNRSKEEIFADIVDAIENSSERKDISIDVQQTSSNPLISLGSLFGFVLVDIMLKRLFRILNISFPSSLAGMVALFAGLALAPEQKTKPFISVVAPGAAILTTYLPVFFAPSLVALPLSPPISQSTMIKLALLIIGGYVVSLYTTAVTALFLRKSIPTGQNDSTDSANLSSAVSVPSPSKNLLKYSVLATILSGAGAIFTQSIRPSSPLLPILATLNMLFGTLAGYIGGTFFSPLLRRVVHPVVTCTAVAWFCALAQGKVLGYGFLGTLRLYVSRSRCPIHLGAGDILLALLGPSIISFAIQMHARRQLIKENAKAVIGGTLFAASSGLFGTAFIARALNLPPALRLATVSRAITSPLAMAIASVLGAEVGIAVAIVVVTGVIGANFGSWLLDLLGIVDPIARGLSQGASSHGLGAAAMSNEPEAFPFAAISMALTATFSTILVNIKPVRHALVKLALGTP